jgi:hypothetical protein
MNSLLKSIDSVSDVGTVTYADDAAVEWQCEWMSASAYIWKHLAEARKNGNLLEALPIREIWFNDYRPLDAYFHVRPAAAAVTTSSTAASTAASLAASASAPVIDLDLIDAHILAAAASSAAASSTTATPATGASTAATPAPGASTAATPASASPTPATPKAARELRKRKGWLVWILAVLADRLENAVPSAAGPTIVDPKTKADPKGKAKRKTNKTAKTPPKLKVDWLDVDEANVARFLNREWRNLQAAAGELAITTPPSPEWGLITITWNKHVVKKSFSDITLLAPSHVELLAQWNGVSSKGWTVPAGSIDSLRTKVRNTEVATSLTDEEKEAEKAEKEKRKKEGGKEPAVKKGRAGDGPSSSTAAATAAAPSDPTIGSAAAVPSGSTTGTGGAASSSTTSGVAAGASSKSTPPSKKLYNETRWMQLETIPENPSPDNDVTNSSGIVFEFRNPKVAPSPSAKFTADSEGTNKSSSMEIDIPATSTTATPASAAAASALPAVTPASTTATGDKSGAGSKATSSKGALSNDDTILFSADSSGHIFTKELDGNDIHAYTILKVSVLLLQQDTQTNS